MSINSVAVIKVIGVGGAGGNAVNRMVDEGLLGVEFFIANTDLQVLNVSPVINKIELGKNNASGNGAGANPEVGEKAAIESEDLIREAVKGADMVFVTAGMGGGTGTGAAPVISRIAQEEGALVVGVITKPFSFEGPRRQNNTNDFLEKLLSNVDSLIIVSNDKLLEVIGNISMLDAFKEADNILRQGVQTITDLIAVPSLINLDFADVRTVMQGQGSALIGIGMAEGEDKALEAAKRAITSPLLEAQIDGARNAIINITGGTSTSMYDASQAVEFVRQASGFDIDIIFGVAVNDNLGDAIIVTVVATGFDLPQSKVETQESSPQVGFKANNEPTTSVKNDGPEIPSYFKTR